MYSTDLVGNTATDMSAMHFCKAAEKIANACIRQKHKRHVIKSEGGERKRLRPRGERSLRGSGRSPKEGTQRVAREEEKHPRCDVLDI